MNGEHEDLEERQQSLLEDMGARLSHALRGEQFWKQTLKKVFCSRQFFLKPSHLIFLTARLWRRENAKIA